MSSSESFLSVSDVPWGPSHSRGTESALMCRRPSPGSVKANRWLKLTGTAILVGDSAEYSSRSARCRHLAERNEYLICCGFAHYHLVAGGPGSLDLELFAYVAGKVL